MNFIDQVKAKMQTAIEHFKNDLKSIRTGRANPAMVDHVTVELYGSPMRLKDVASVTTPESRQILITPYDPQTTNTIAKAIDKSDLGFRPMVDGNVIRLNVPPMTEELRKKMAKTCHEEREKTKISIRNIRREGNDTLRKQKANGDLSEDQLKKFEKNIQELTDKFCQETDSLSEKKEKEIETI